MIRKYKASNSTVRIDVEDITAIVHNEYNITVYTGTAQITLDMDEIMLDKLVADWEKLRSDVVSDEAMQMFYGVVTAEA